MNFEGQLNNKLPQSGLSIFAQMTAMANEHKAINLAQGFPEFDTYPELKKAVFEAMKKGYNQYAPMPGLMSLREKIAKKTEELYSANYHPEKEITIMPGATHAIFNTILALTKENDEVIVIEPAYDNYIPAINLAGAKAITYQLTLPDFKIDWQQIKKLISIRTKLIIINTPHNPSGSILTAEDFIKLEKMIDGTDILVLSDEVYEHIIFDGKEHQSICRFPKLAKRSIVISSFGKTYHTTGWKMGYTLAPENITEQIRKVYQFMAFSANTPVQHAYAEILENKDLYLGLNDFYQQKRDLFVKAIKTSKFKIIPCNGTYFQSVFYDKISDLSDFEMAMKLVKEYSIASIPFSPFYKNKTDVKALRFCFAKKDETLLKALDILCKI